MELMRRAGLVLALILTARAAEIPHRSDPDHTTQDGKGEEGDWAARRSWTEGDGVEEVDGRAMLVESSYGVIPGGDLRSGGWSAVAPLVGGAFGEDSAVPWDVVASESEARGVYSGERTRWMPTKSRYRSRPKEPATDDSVEIPLQEHQRRQRLQLQQQLLKRTPEGRRGVMQLENLGGGILEDEDEDEEEPEEESKDDEEEEVSRPVRVRSRVPPPPQPFSKLPALRPPAGTNEPTPGKPPTPNDLKSILKMSGPLSLSEILQGKNLSLEELLRGSRLALSAVAQSATTESVETRGRAGQRRRRPNSSGSRPQLKRRRPTSPTDILPDLPTTSTVRYITTTAQTTTERITTTTIATTTEEPKTTTAEEPEVTTVRPSIEESPQSSQWITSSGDPAKDILEIILQEDENDGPSLADVLSSRNMTVADLIQQRERASGRSTITSLFPPPSSAVREWQRRKGREEERGGGKAAKEDDGRRGRKFTDFDHTETDWEDPSEAEKEEKPLEKEEETADQQVTQTRNNYQIISSRDAVVEIPEMHSETNDVNPSTPSETTIAQPPVPTETNVVHHAQRSDEKISQTHLPFLREIPTFQDEGHRPIIRTRVTSPTTTTEEIFPKEDAGSRNPEIRTSQRAAHGEYRPEESVKSSVLPEGVKSAIIASTSLLGIALLIFLAIFAAFRYRQWRRRRGMGPYLCAAVLEAAVGGKKRKGPKIIKQGKRKEKGWGDTFDSAQERLWRTLRRGRCRFYDHDNGQM